MTRLNERIRLVMGRVFGCDPSSINDAASSETMEDWDSLRHMNLIVALEDEFDVRFSDDQVEKLTSFRGIESSLSELSISE